jgi:S-adenosylmethionine decarboxylase
MNYQPGLHILSEVTTDEVSLLKEYQHAKNFFNEKIKEYNLNPLGEIFHQFEGSGYTGVICLTESHIAIHTWPEHNMLTFDVYLSNFMKNNDDITRKIFEDTISFFKAKKFTCKEVRR